MPNLESFDGVWRELWVDVAAVYLATVVFEVLAGGTVKQPEANLRLRRVILRIAVYLPKITGFAYTLLLAFNFT